MHLAFDVLGNILWETKEPNVVMTDNKELNRFFSGRTHSLYTLDFLWSDACFKFVLPHVSGVENPAADYLSHLKIRPQDRISLRVADCIAVFHAAIEIASKRPKQEVDETDYYSHDGLMRISGYTGRAHWMTNHQVTQGKSTRHRHKGYIHLPTNSNTRGVACLKDKIWTLHWDIMQGNRMSKRCSMTWDNNTTPH